MLVKIAQDPEETSFIQQLWRPLNAISAMPSDWKRPAYQFIDAGYCLDRYSLIDAPKE